MSQELSQVIKCTDCKLTFPVSELKVAPKDRQPCPQCGSLRRMMCLTTTEGLTLNEYVGLAARKKHSTRNNKKRADFEVGEGNKYGRDGKLVIKKVVFDREHPDADGSYQEYVRDKEGNIIVNKSEKLSEHFSKKTK